MKALPGHVNPSAAPAAALRVTRRVLAFGAAVARRIGIAPILLLLAFLAPLPTDSGTSIGGLPSLCVFRNQTGIPCAGCGITRAMVCLAHGHVSEAIAYHPLSPLAFALLVGLTLNGVIALVRPDQPRSLLTPRLVALLGWAAVAALLLVWAARLAQLLPWPP